MRKETRDGREPLSAAVIICALLVFGIALRLCDTGVNGRSPDELVYTAQAKVVAQDGVEGVRRLITEFNANEEAWIYPTPIRIGYTFLLAPLMKATGAFDERAGSYLSTACSIGALLALALIGLRFFNPWITAAALLLMSVSPMDLAIARRSWQDGILALFALLLIYFCCELTAHPERRAWYIPFWITGSYCIIIKESGIVIYGLCVIWLLAVAALKERSVVKSALLIVFTLLGIGMSVFVLAQASGGIERVLEVLRHMKDAMPTNTYAVEYQSGPWYRMIEGLWILTPACVILAATGIAGSLVDKAPRSGAAKGIAFIIIAFLGITILTPYCQNIRFISVLYVPFYLMCGAGAWHIFSFAKPSLKAPMQVAAVSVIVCALIAVAVRDHNTFGRIFIKKGIRDISIRLLREAS